MNIAMNLLLIFIMIVIFRNARKTGLKFTHGMLAVYVGALLIATVLFPLITEDALRLKRVDALEANQAWNELNQNLSKGQIDQVERRYLLGEKSIDARHTDFIQLHNTDNDPVLVYVERKAIRDEKIEAFVFAEGLWIEGYDFSDQLEPLRIHLQPDNRLFIAPPRQHIKIGLIDAEFPVRQVIGEPWQLSHLTSSSQVVYLRVPSDLTVASGDNIHLQMIETKGGVDDVARENGIG